MNPIKEVKRIESRMDIETYIAKLKYAIQGGSAKMKLVQNRNVDQGRDPKYTNTYTLADLFPKEDYVEAIKKELALLTSSHYIETVKDTRFPKKSEMRVFGKTFKKDDVYIKIRVELVSVEHAFGENFIMVMSFHYAERSFVKEDFPYRKTGDCDE